MKRATYALLAAVGFVVAGGLYLALTIYPLHRDPVQSAVLVALLLAVAIVEITLDNTTF